MTTNGCQFSVVGNRPSPSRTDNRQPITDNRFYRIGNTTDTWCVMTVASCKVIGPLGAIT